MKTNTIAVAIALTIGGTALFANTEAHQWNLAVEQAPAFCRFSDNIPVELVSNPTTGRFELVSPGSLTIVEQGMGEISYLTDGRIRILRSGVSIGIGQGWDLTGTTLTGQTGNVDAAPSCPDQSCFGVNYKLPSDTSGETYTLSIEGSVGAPDDYTPTTAELLYVNFIVRCAESAGEWVPLS